MQRWTTNDRSDDAPPELPAHVLEEEGAPVAYFEKERTAQLVAVLLNSRDAAPEEKPTPRRIERQRQEGARGAWGGHEEPQRGRVYSLTGLAGGGVAEDVTDQEEERRRPSTPPPSAPRAIEPARDEDEAPDVSRTPCGGGTVTVWPSGWSYVRFTSRPAGPVLEELRTAGARWMGTRKGWRIQAEALPEGYDRPEHARQVQR